MFYEFAIDPDLFSDMHIFYRCIDKKFSILSGRIIAKYPRKLPFNWWTMVRDKICNLDDQMQNYITEWYSNSSDFIVEPDYDYDPSQDWLTNAENVNNVSNCFHAIISRNNPRNNPNVISISDIQSNYILNDNRFTLPEETCTINSDKDSFIDAMKVLIKYSNKIILIDPHFSGDKRWGVLIDALFSCISLYRKNSVLPVYITVAEDKEKAKVRKKMILGLDGKNAYTLYKEISEDQKLKIIFVKKIKSDHDRFILTDWWGIKFSRGLDASMQTQFVNILKIKDYEDCYEYYQQIVENTQSEGRIILIFTIDNNGVVETP